MSASPVLLSVALVLPALSFVGAGVKLMTTRSDWTCLTAGQSPYDDPDGFECSTEIYCDEYPDQCRERTEYFGLEGEFMRWCACNGDEIPGYGPCARVQFGYWDDQHSFVLFSICLDLGECADYGGECFEWQDGELPWRYWKCSCKV
jgi:hypothetical protein